MASFAGESATPQTRYAAVKHAVRAFGYACARLPRLPAYRLTTSAIPLPDGMRRIYLYHVRKTGGTSLAHSFLALGGEDPGRVERRMRRPPFCTASGPYRFAYQDPPLLRSGYYFFGYGHKPAGSVNLPARTFTVTILRDPADRVVSLYRYLADPRADEGQTFHSLGYEREWARDGFGRFLDRLSRAQLLNQLHMFSSSGSVHEAAEAILACDRVLRTESLDADMGELATFLGLQLVPRRVRASRLDYSPADSEAARLRELLEPEYRLLSLVTSAAPGLATGACGPPPSPGGAPFSRQAT